MRLEPIHGNGIDLVGKRPFRHQTQPVARVAEVQRGLVPVDHEARAGGADRTGNDGQREPAGELRQQFDMLRHVALQGARRIAVRAHRLGAGAHDALWKFGAARRQHQGEQPMRHQVAQQTGAVRIKLAPAEEMIRIKGNLLVNRAEPHVPIDRFGCCARVDLVIPFAFGIIAAVVALAPNQFPDLSALDQLRRLVPGRRRATL